MSLVEPLLLLLVGAAATAAAAYLREHVLWRRRRWDDRKPDLFADYLHSLNQSVRLLSEAAIAREAGDMQDYNLKRLAAQDERHNGRRLLALVQLLEPVLNQEASRCYDVVRDLRSKAVEGVTVNDQRWRDAHIATDEARAKFVVAASKRLHLALPARREVRKAWEHLAKEGYRQGRGPGARPQ